ncbi:hypothetical protein D3C73_1390660 [compost metagenome]
MLPGPDHDSGKLRVFLHIERSRVTEQAEPFFLHIGIAYSRGKQNRGAGKAALDDICRSHRAHEESVHFFTLSCLK